MEILGAKAATPTKKNVCHDLTGIRKVRREAMRHQAFLDRDYGNRARKSGKTGSTLFQLYIKSDKTPSYFIQKRMNQAKRRKRGKQG